jgi:hypothetical protein
VAERVKETLDERQRAERHRERGAEGGDESDAARKPPPVPADDSSPVGDTDQHSDADA